MKLFNSLNRQLEEFKSIKKGEVGIYTCGPTVYDYVSIGNWRTYFLGDLLARVFRYDDYKVDYVMNITDVGHLTGDNLGDADTGEDRMEKGAKKEGKTAWEIASYYTDDFYKGFEALNLTKPLVWCKATDHIEEQIELVKKIEAKGISYKTSDGIYFDVGAYEKMGSSYGELSNLDKIQAGARVKINPEKKDQRDFALWKFSPEGEKRQMEWDSPWGKGFPGWHVECSAMSMKYLGEQFDVHVGGEDLKSTHHPNEIAQSEAATGKKPFVNYWVHGSFLQVDGGRMGKSLGNAYTIKDLETKGFSALDLRYLYLTCHYRKQLNFTWQALTGAKEAYGRLRSIVAGWQGKKGRTSLASEKLGKIQEFSLNFRAGLENDLNTPQALAVVWEMVKSNIPEQDKWDLVKDWDEVLGLQLTKVEKSITAVPEEIKKLADERNSLRLNQEWSKADELRAKITQKGFRIEDVGAGYKLKKQ